MSDVSRSLYDEILQQIALYQRPVAFKLDATVIVDGFTFKPYRVIHLDVKRDFQNNYVDETVIELAFSEGDFTRHVYPNRQKLQLELTRTPIGEVEDTELISIRPTTKRYSAILQDSKNMDLQGLPSTAADQTLMGVKFQLLELAPEQLRLQSVGGGFYNTKPSDVIKALLGKYSKALKLPNEAAVKGVSVWPPSNDTVREHVIIEHGVELLEIVGYMQKFCLGLYNSGAGFYYHNNVWFVYPYMDDTRYAKDDYVLDVLIVPPNRLPESDRTYRAIDGRIQIISTGGNRQSNTSDIDYLQHGNGVTFVPAKTLFNRFAKTQGNVATADSSKTVSRFLLEARDTQLQFAPFSSNKITDNSAYEFSKLRSRGTQVIAFAWDNARPDLLYPGMPIKLYYGKESGSEELYGCLASVVEHTKPNQSGMGIERYKSSCVITALFPAN